MILFTLGAMAHIRYYIISEHAYVLTTTKMSQPVKEIVSKLFHLTAITWILKANTLFLFYQRIKPRNDSFEYHSTFHYFIGLRNYFDFILRNLLLKLTVICQMLQKKFNSSNATSAAIRDSTSYRTKYLDPWLVIFLYFSRW